MMDSEEVFEAAFTGVLPALSLPSLRLLVPPLQLMTASMWQVVKQREVMSYWKVAEFVSLVTEVIPELLVHKHSTQLHLGLRARYILELCRSEQLADPEFISLYLDKVKPVTPKPAEENAVEMDVMETHFLELVQTLLKDSEEREHFFTEVFPVEYGPHYDSDLQTLFYEFLCRLTQFLPTPDFEQTVSWLGSATSVLEECVLLVSAPTDLKNLLQHHKHLGHFEQHVPPSPMGDCIISTLSAIHPSRVVVATDQPGCDNQMDPLQCLNDDANPVSFVDDIAVEIIAVTDYAEVELGTSSAEDAAEVVVITCFEGTVIETVTEDIMETLPALQPEVLRVEKAEGAEVVPEAGEDIGPAVLVRGEEAVDDDQVSSRHKPTSGPHVCPQCEKSFKFASSLLAHRVIHSGERPYRCNQCDQCFSFRQSLDRHKHTHNKRGRTYDCAVCGEAFRSPSARLEHKRTHRRDGAHVCLRCDRRFGSESALARHLKSEAECHHHHHAGSDSSGLIETTVKATQGEEEVAAALPESDSPVAPRVEREHICDRDPKGEGGRNSPRPSSQPGDDDTAETLVKVRTSGRRRKPTMKVQAIDSQKRIGKDSAAKKRRSGSVLEKPPVLKPEPFNSTEHSYGSPMLSAKDADEGPVGDGSTTAFSCPTCSFCHTDEAKVQQHVDDVHSAEGRDSKPAAPPLLPGDQEAGRFGCPDCPKCFKFRSLLKAHRRLHTGEQPYLCSQCGRRFSFKQSLERHRQTHKDGCEYECPVCDQVFTSLAALKEHRGSHMDNGDYVCTECGRAFTWKSALVRHLKTHRDEDEEKKAQRPHKCSQCDMVFGSAGQLGRHLQTHREERAYACNCGKSFAYQAALRAHQRIHQEERPHRCAQCGKGFLYNGGLLSHMKIHSEEMPFMCSFCGKSFKRERNMKKHERCHTRENVFSCSQCDKSFVYKATLTRHELTHSGERPFLCSDCGKGFFSHAELLKHERFHTGHKPFQCPHCGKQFTQSCYLTIHLRYHTGARPYSCNDCDKSFLSANRLKRHQRTHTGEKPYLCVECGKGFKQSYHLKMHQRTHALKL